MATQKKGDAPEQRALALDLTKFDYTKLVGQSFKEYNELVAGLEFNKKYDFEMYKVEPVIVERFPGIKDSPKDVVGFKLVKDTPIKTTRLELRHIHDMNGRVYADEAGRFFTVVGGQWCNGNGGNSAYYGHYYLLKK